jgi:catechol 2,3-dioxygenase-like lactoylglutathione lyase family enzyme
MKNSQAILSLVTLGVSDLKRSIVFYEALGFQRKAKAAGGVVFPGRRLRFRGLAGC